MVVPVHPVPEEPRVVPERLEETVQWVFLVFKDQPEKLDHLVVLVLLVTMVVLVPQEHEEPQVVLEHQVETEQWVFLVFKDQPEKLDHLEARVVPV